jgi:hypothetical protein
MIIQDNRTNSIRAILFLIGSFTFAFLLGEAVHELGHYLSHLAYGNTGVGVHLDPWGGSRITGVKSLPLTVMGITSLAGPFFNLLLGISTFLVFYRYLSPLSFPFLLWGPVSMIQEGVTFTLGMLTPGGDAAWVAAMGIPVWVILAVGGFLFAAGLILISSLLSKNRILGKGSFGSKLVSVLVGFGFLMTLRFLQSFLAAPERALENLIPLIFSILLSLVIVVMEKPVFSVLGLGSSKTLIATDWPATGFALILGGSMFAFQMLSSSL